MPYAITLFSFFAFTGAVGLITWWTTRKADHQTSTGYFLAGRSLTFPFIAGSLLLTNLSTEQMVGLNGSAFRYGLSVMAWEVVAVLALVAMALFFLPRFLKSGIATLPQFLGLRFDGGTQIIANLIFLGAYTAILLPIILYTGAAGLMGMLDLSALTGIENTRLLVWLTVWFVGIIGACYALFGGLNSIAVSDMLNGIGLLIGGFLITYFGLQAVSGGDGVFEGWRILQDTNPERFNSVGGPETEVPFFTLFTGVLLLNLFYWCTNQQIIQRTFGASSLAEGQKGVLLTGLFKLLGPLYLVLPGIIAFHLYAERDIHPDHAYGMLVFDVLPAPLTGFFAAVMAGAILSSFNSALNATTTLFGTGIYKAVLNKQASDQQVVRVSKRFGWVVAIGAMIIAPLLIGQEGIFTYLQQMNGIYFIPIFAVVVVAILAPRVPPLAAKVALLLGCGGIAVGYFVPPFNQGVAAMGEFHFLGGAFVLLVLIMLLIGWLRPLPTPWAQTATGDVEMTPWRFRVPAAAVLVVLVLLIYVSFADFSVLFSG
ncbi:solute:sodium symporter family transporter [Phycisphaerales bacterium AB-hyl4]|uniref:Solute:sodium symporter family transporter n=1 Tax=Natronomicrosphaera hydrolytica TaxID=3242702 RepID=A0ABV4U3A8_9BACT